MKKIRFVGVVEKTEDGRKKLFRKYYFRVLLPNGKSVSSTRFLQVGEDENTIYREFEKACIQEAITKRLRPNITNISGNG